MFHLCLLTFKICEIELWKRNPVTMDYLTRVWQEINNRFDVCLTTGVMCVMSFCLMRFVWNKFLKSILSFLKPWIYHLLACIMYDIVGNYFPWLLLPQSAGRYSSITGRETNFKGRDTLFAEKSHLTGCHKNTVNVFNQMLVSAKKDVNVLSEFCGWRLDIDFLRETRSPN